MAEISGYHITRDGREVLVNFSVTPHYEVHDIGNPEFLPEITPVHYYLDGLALSFVELSKELGLDSAYAAIDAAAQTY